MMLEMVLDGTFRKTYEREGYFVNLLNFVKRYQVTISYTFSNLLPKKVWVARLKQFSDLFLTVMIFYWQQIS